MSRIREMAVLAACERVIRSWPLRARIAFHDAVMRDVSAFSTGSWDVVAVHIRAEAFFTRWERGLPWPPDPNELVPPPPPPPPPIDRPAVENLARRICALGVELAVASR